MFTNLVFSRSFLPGTLVAICALALLVFTPGCDSADPEPETGTVSGVVLAPDGQSPVGGATVTLADAALFRPGPGHEVRAFQAPQTTTDSEGRFTLEEVPAGDQTLIARRGLFSITFTVNVVPGQVVDVPPSETTLEQDGSFASIPGSFDSMEEIGAELEIEIDIVQASIFDDLADAAEYGMIFLNCATQVSGDQRLANALAFMQGGGTLYASDLSGGTASALIDDLQTGSGGTSSQTIEAQVVHEPLASAIGREEVSITYNLSGWHRIQEMPADAVPLLQGTRSGEEEGEPLAIVVPVGQGQLVYTTFHNTAGLQEDQRALLRYFIFLGGEPI